ncbi:MAG: helicase-related protein [Flavobacteriaceae bacterium]
MRTEKSQKSISYSGIRDNVTRGKAGDFLISKLSKDTVLSVVSAYFTIHAYHALKAGLDKISKLRFLFGDPQFVNLLEKDSKESKEFSLIDGHLDITNQLQQGKLARECAEWIKDRAEIRTVNQSGLLHGKLYHVQNGEVDHAMLGSSNFTVPGLGLRESGNNVELNIVVQDNRDRDDLLSWFNEWWSKDSLTNDIKDVVLRELARLYSNQSPEFIYYLTLFNIFREFIDGERDADADLTKVQLPDTKIWRTLYSFQKDGAKTAINKIRELNGCILADSVGLGKTFTALAVIKYFELKNERVLVLCPKKLSRNWTIYRSPDRLNPFSDDKFRFDVLHHTDLSREKGEVNGLQLETLNWGAYDLVVIDESHNFRNNARAKQEEGEPRKRSRYERLVEDIVTSGSNTKILLLSATPVNNELSDLRNQVSFIAGGDVTRDSKPDGAFAQSLKIISVKETTRKAQQHFTRWAKQPSNKRTNKDLLQAIGGDFFKLLDGLSIARSRKQIARYYKDEMERLGGFPKRPKPLSLHPPIDLRPKKISFEELDTEISELSLALYHPTKFLRPDLLEAVRASYVDERMNGFTQEGRERILISMMKVNFLKRLESSIDSFRLTIQRTIEKIDKLEAKFVQFEAFQGEQPEVDYDVLDPEVDDDEGMETSDFLVGGKRKFYLGHIDIDKWRKAIKHDRAQLEFLLHRAEKTTPVHDGKLAKLREQIFEKLDNPTTNSEGKANRKVLVFTAFADTASYLFDQLKDGIRDRGSHIALVQGSSENRSTFSFSNDFDDVLTNFSPISKRRAEQTRFPQEEEIDVLIATDCISEGQNLQDCDLLINYDIHWNPVRIIQRFGRIDRIGSLNESVSLVNFWPVADLDRYLNVKHRVEARMALVDLSATQEDNLLENDQVEELISKDLLFRNKQLKRMQDEILDLEDFDDNITLSDFSLDEFRIDLLQFLESRRAELEAAKPGLYAVVPTKDDQLIGRQGVIFCLRHRKQTAHQEKDDSETAKQINPLGRYYLIYLYDDGTVRLTFAQPKQALNLFRDLAAGLPAAQDNLCDLFDTRTANGSDMKHYDGLIKKALESIAHTFTRRAAASLFSGRDGKLPSADETPTELEYEYELLTWLVILDKGGNG